MYAEFSPFLSPFTIHFPIRLLPVFFARVLYTRCFLVFLINTALCANCRTDFLYQYCLQKCVFDFW